MDDECFALVVDAHHFLVGVLPYREPRSLEAVATFIAAVKSRRVSLVTLEAVLVEVLDVLNHSRDASAPSSVASFLALRSEALDLVTCFARCVTAAIVAGHVRDPLVALAMTLVRIQASGSSLTLASVAAQCECTPSSLATRFKAEMGVTVCQYIRECRIMRAADLLSDPRRRVKEVWAAVGYNYASDFAHHFKKQYGVSPTEYRRNRIAHIPHEHTACHTLGDTQPCAVHSDDSKAHVLVVDDDEISRVTISKCLALEGYTVSTADSERALFQCLNRFRPAIILLDYRLPDADGMECLRAVRRRFTAKQIAVLLFSADWDLEAQFDEIRLLDAFMLSKLSSLDDLLALIAAILGTPGTASAPIRFFPTTR